VDRKPLALLSSERTLYLIVKQKVKLRGKRREVNRTSKSARKRIAGVLGYSILGYISYLVTVTETIKHVNWYWFID
jgi:hypothetical protein